MGSKQGKNVIDDQDDGNVDELEIEHQKNQPIPSFHSNNIQEKENESPSILRIKKNKETEELSESLIKNSPNRTINIRPNKFGGSPEPKASEELALEKENSISKSPDLKEEPKSHNVSSILEGPHPEQKDGTSLFEKMIGSQILEERYKEKIRHHRRQKEEEERLVKDQLEQKRIREQLEWLKRLVPHNQTFYDVEKKWLEEGKLEGLEKSEEQRFSQGYYRGYMKNGVRHGPGTFKFNNLSIYNGEFEDNIAQGYGVIVHKDDSRYEGEWKNGKAHGKGKYTYADGTYYEGEFLNDLRHGFGKETFKDGSVYEGDHELNKKQGKGTFSFADGSYYKGSMLEDKFHGFGEFYWSNGDVYKGDWENGMMHGVGQRMYNRRKDTEGNANKEKEKFASYQGQFAYDKKDGHGVFYWEDGRKYDGQWRGGKQHGVGLYTNIRFESRKGIWKNGKLIKWTK